MESWNRAVEGNDHWKLQESLGENEKYSGNGTVEHLELIRNEMTVHVLYDFVSFNEE